MSLSRIGKQPIKIPSGVTVTKEGDTVLVKGPKGELSTQVGSSLDVRIEQDSIVVDPKSDTKEAKADHGLYRSLIQNTVTGVSEGFKKQLEVHGVGYRVAMAGKTLKLQLGYSHEINFEIPEGIEIAVEGNNITVSGHDKQLVGQTAANIRALRKPEPYKGKGIRYTDEYIIRKSGKTTA